MKGAAKRTTAVIALRITWFDPRVRMQATHSFLDQTRFSYDHPLFAKKKRAAHQSRSSAPYSNQI